MGFVTYTFLFVFLPITLALYYAVRPGARLVVLTIASFIFYAWWRLDFCGLFLASTLASYRLGQLIDQSQDIRLRKRWLTIALALNFGMLGYFKYANFFIANANELLGAMGIHQIAWTSVILPIGISFYTFHITSYLVDVYRRDAQASKSFVQYACYISMFPQLVAGPIVRYNTIAAQLVERSHTPEKFARGILLFMIGFCKKVLLADQLARLADFVFGASSHGFTDSWLGLYAYTMQLYFDFSGYSDMAIGLALMFGFEFLKNFDSPFKSRSITEFWRRRHMSLSQWLRNYLYIPLGGNRHGEARTYLNLSATMLLGGIWHGANWTFLIWGGYQGVLLIAERLNGKRPVGSFGIRFLEWPSTFLLVMVGWAIFRAPDFSSLSSLLGGLLGLGGTGSLHALIPIMKPLTVLTLVLTGVLAFWAPQSWDIAARITWPRAIVFSSLFLLAIIKMIFSSYTPFLYFQF